MFKIPYRGVPNYLTLAFVSSGIIWTLAAYYNTLIVEIGCSKMAELSTNIIGKRTKFDPVYSFDSLKYRCIVETVPQGKAFLAFYAILPSSQTLF